MNKASGTKDIVEMQNDASFMSPAMMRAYENALKAERSGKVRAANSVDELMLGIE